MLKGKTRAVTVVENVVAVVCKDKRHVVGVRMVTVTVMAEMVEVGGLSWILVGLDKNPDIDSERWDQEQNTSPVAGGHRKSKKPVDRPSNKFEGRELESWYVESSQAVGRRRQQAAGRLQQQQQAAGSNKIEKVNAGGGGGTCCCVVTLSYTLSLSLSLQSSEILYCKWDINK
ncbi:hypothetical protein K440DRAFT_640656 [Wilcoxina mikolae CBS 423.85]|nr:hypothetical protein K440DRAFT_640656 [Wilcoxina mikolae CBS 423.85]